MRSINSDGPKIDAFDEQKGPDEQEDINKYGGVDKHGAVSFKSSVWLENIRRKLDAESFETVRELRSDTRRHEVAENIAAKIGWHGRINWYRKPKRDGEIYYLNSTHDKARRKLGWEPRIDLDTGLTRTIEAWRTRAR